MKYLISVLVFLSVSANVAADVFKQANDLLKQRDYNGVITSLTESMPSLSEEKKMYANLLVGIAAYNNFILYSRLQSEAVDSQLTYYGKLATKKDRKKRSPYAYLYLGQAYLAKDYYGKAMRNLTRFLRKKNLNARQVMIGKLDKAVVLSRLKRKGEANRLLARIKTNDAEVTTHILATKLRMGKKVKGLKALLDALSKRPGLSARSVSNLLYIYNHINEPASQSILKQEVLSMPAFVDTSKGAEIKFYDSTLIANLSRYYHLLAERNLKRVSQHEKHGSVASYYLSKTYIESKDYSHVNEVVKHIKKSTAPETFKATADIWDQVAKNKGRKTANGKISGVADKYASNNKVLANALLACVHVGSNCNGIVDQAQGRVKQGSGLKFAELNFALGKYYLRKKQLDLALGFFEAARDKSKKNRIDANDPLLLVNLAQVYRRTRVFSENLEIYFEMSKYFPVVRQIQDAVQGVYSMEQKSAGDVKIL